MFQQKHDYPRHVCIHRVRVYYLLTNINMLRITLFIWPKSIMAWHDAIYIALARIPPKNILKISLHIYNAFSKKSPHIYIYIYISEESSVASNSSHNNIIYRIIPN